MKPLFAVFAATLTLGTIVSAADTHESLYARLGGEKAVHALVDEWTHRVVADADVHKWYGHFAKDAHAEAAFEKNVADYFCKATGGACAYHGPATVVAGEHITAAAFADLEKHMVETLDHMKIHDAEKHELLAIFEALKPAVVAH
jgi:hemoglobin